MDTIDYFERAAEALAHARENHEGADDLSALRAIGSMTEALQNVIPALVQLAYNAGATKKAIALAIGVPPSYLRGLERSGV